MRTLADLRTPALVVDRAVLARNTERMRERAETLGVTLRPHLKTAKSSAVADLAVDASRAITVSTLAEAEYFLARGFPDQTYAVGIVPGKLDAVAALERRGARLGILLDDPDVARAVCERARAGGVRFRVYLEVDTGLHRTGLDATTGRFLETARPLHESDAVDLRGVLAHAGHAYGAGSPEEIRRIAAAERDGAAGAARRLEEAGIPCPVVSVGSTPTALHADHLEGVTEIRPGNYVFFDLFQWCLGSCEKRDIAVSVLASVISHDRGGGRLVLDAGAIALSKDRGADEVQPGTGYGLLVAEDGTELPGSPHVARVHQEHGLVESGEPIPFDRLPIGSRLRVLPSHSCLTAAAYDRYHVVDGGTSVVDTWDRVNGW